MSTISAIRASSGSPGGVRGSPQGARAALSARLQARRGEIEQAILTRVQALAEDDAVCDPQYLEGLRASVSAAVGYALVAIELGEERSPPIPATLLYQSRLAVRSRVSLDAVLRRYVAGYTLLGDFIIQEAQDGALLQGAELQRVMQAPAAILERLIATVVEEYTRESEGRTGSEEERNAERVRRLLAGELLDTSAFSYEFDAWHVALVAGPGGIETVRELASALDRRLLLVHSGEGAIWAWLGGRRKVEVDDFEQHFPASWPEGLAVAIGEPAEGLAGWRLSHQQARAALPIALRSPCEPIRYAEVARETLRAYFAAERNISSAAAAIGVSRRTVANRLRAVEAKLGCSLGTVGPEIEAALRLHDLESSPVFLGAAPGDAEQTG
jgi:predicted DNA-binding protein (UPF0251 family)